MITITLGWDDPLTNLLSERKLSLCCFYSRWDRTACLKALEKSSISQCTEDMITRRMILYICFQLEMIMMYRDWGIMENVKVLQLWKTEVIIQKIPLAERMCLYNQGETNVKYILDFIFSDLYFITFFIYFQSRPLLNSLSSWEVCLIAFLQRVTWYDRYQCPTIRW